MASNYPTEVVSQSGDELVIRVFIRPVATVVPNRTRTDPAVSTEGVHPFGPGDVSVSSQDVRVRLARGETLTPSRRQVYGQRGRGPRRTTQALMGEELGPAGMGPPEAPPVFPNGWVPRPREEITPNRPVYYGTECCTRWPRENEVAINCVCGHRIHEGCLTSLLRAYRHDGCPVCVDATTYQQRMGPTAPRAPKVTYFGLINHDHQEQSWYRLSWQAPTASNCESFRRQNIYGIYYNGTWQWTFNNLPQFDIYLDSDRGIEFTIRAYNNENLPSLVVDVSMSLVQLQALRSCPDPPTVDNADLVGPTEAREPGSQLLYQCRGVVTHASGMYTCQNIGGTLEWTGDLVCHKKAISRLIITLVVPLTAVIIILGLVLLFTSWRKRSENANRPSGSGIQRDTSVDDFNNPEYDRIELQHNIPDPEYANVADTQRSKGQIGCYENALNSSRLNKQVYETVDCSPEDNHIYNVAG